MDADRVMHLIPLPPDPPPTPELSRPMGVRYTNKRGDSWIEPSTMWSHGPLNVTDDDTFERWCNLPVHDLRTLEEFAEDGGTHQSILGEWAKRGSTDRGCTLLEGRALKRALADRQANGSLSENLPTTTLTMPMPPVKVPRGPLGIKPPPSPADPPRRDEVVLKHCLTCGSHQYFLNGKCWQMHGLTGNTGTR